MLKIENFVTASPEQMEMIVGGTRNPMNSWGRSDSYITHIEDPVTLETADYAFFMGENDLDLCERLAAGGSVHAKYRRMMPVWVDIVAPLYWWKEFDTYKVGTVANSCSTMHKIHAKEFTLEDFSYEHLISIEDHRMDNLRSEFLELGAATRLDDTNGAMTVYFDSPLGHLKYTIGKLNVCRKLFLDDTIKSDRKIYWWQMIQLLPTSYNQKRTVMLNYEVLVGIYRDRRNHKLDEWHTFCHWIEELPYSELIIGKVDDNSRV